jgi:hypothetical protein
MNQPLPAENAPTAIEMLDRCLARMRRGLPLELVGSDAPEQAGELAPLLALAQRLSRWGARPIPAPPADLLPGRARFLAAGAALAKAEAVSKTGTDMDDPTPDRLDAAVAQLTAGRSSEEALAHLNGDRESLRPLVRLVGQLRSATRTAPAAPDGLMRGRLAFLEHGAALREAEAAARVPHAALLSSLDMALERQTRGLRPTAGLDEALATELLPLVEVAGALQLRIAPVPPPPGALAAGRARFLLQAEALRGLERRDAIPSAPVAAGGRSWWRGWLGGSLRLAASVAAAVSLFFGGTRALETSAKQSLPGDLLYPVKRANEGLDRMLVAFDQGELRRLRVEQAGRRAEEVAQLAAEGRYSERWLAGAFLGFETVDEGASPRGILRLRVPAEGEPATVLTVAWDERSRFDLGALRLPSDLAVGQALRLRLRTGAGDDLPLLLRLETDAASPQAPPAQPPATASTAPSATPRAITATPARPMSSRTPLATAPRPASETPPPATATASGAPLATSPAPAAAATADRGLGRLEGVVAAKQDPAALWALREFNSDAAVNVDVSDIDPALRDGIAVGDAVRVSYRKGSSPRRAVKLVLLQAQACPMQSAVGTVRSFDGDLLVLEDGRSYRVSRSTRGVGDLQPGVELTLTYRDCGDGAQVESIQTTASSAFVGTGIVAGLAPFDDGVMFDLLTDDGPRRVKADGRTRVVGRGLDRAGALGDGMLVRVVGLEDGFGTVFAARVEVLALATLPEATATPEPTLTVTATTLPPVTVEPLPLPVDPLPPPDLGNQRSR